MRCFSQCKCQGVNNGDGNGFGKEEYVILDPSIFILRGGTRQ